MSFVRLNWDYGDTTTIEGFRVYRDGELRAEIDKSITTYDDDTTTYSPTLTTYKIVAYDIFGKESLSCEAVEVQLVNYLTPLMTGQNTPSGEALAVVGPTAGAGITTPLGYNYFNRGTTELNWTSNSSGSSIANLDIRVYYTWTNQVIIEQWGWIEDKYASSNSATYGDFVLYGTNDTITDPLTDDIWEEIGRISATSTYANGTRVVRDTTNAGKEYRKIKIQFNGVINAYYGYTSKIRDLLVLGRP